MPELPGVVDRGRWLLSAAADAAFQRGQDENGNACYGRVDAVGIDPVSDGGEFGHRWDAISDQPGQDAGARLLAAYQRRRLGIH